MCDVMGGVIGSGARTKGLTERGLDANCADTLCTFLGITGVDALGF